MKIPTLLSTIHVSVSITSEHLRRIQIIDAEDYSGVIRKTREFLSETGRDFTEDYLCDGVLALKQYYAIAMLDPANAHVVSVPVDPFWHSHILHTQQYSDFCYNVVGEYMHHIPLDHSCSEKVENVRILYDYTQDVLRRLFVSVSDVLWPENDGDVALICFHKGNQGIYPELQNIRLYEPDPRGVNYAF